MVWNSHVNQDEIQIPLGKKKTDYHLIQKIEIKKKVDNLPKQNQEKLSSFRDELRLKCI